jgi:excisionase family DNA binding protein
MTTRAAISSRLPVIFGLSRAEAAAAVGVSANTFDAMVKDGRMPAPRLIGGRKVWDVDDLRAAFKAMPRDGEASEGSSWADVA